MSKVATIIAFRDDDLISFENEITNVSKEDIQDLPVWAGPRDFLETYPQFRQLIPYILIKKGNTFFQYHRAVSGNEARLHGKISIGIGGHVEMMDASISEPSYKVDLLDTIYLNAIRETKEEIGIKVTREDLDIVAVIRSNDADVDKVHLGVVILCDITERVIGELTFEDTIKNPSFRTLMDISADDHEKETWTKLVLDVL